MGQVRQRGYDTVKATVKIALGVLALLMLIGATGDYLRSRLWPPEKDAYLLPVVGVTDADAVRAVVLALGIVGIVGFTVSCSVWARRKQSLGFPVVTELGVRPFSKRRSMSDQQFVAGLAVSPAIKEIVLGVRAGVARAMGVAPEALYPDDSFEQLLRCPMDGMDFVEVLVGIEKVMGVQLRQEMAVEAIEKLGGGSMKFTLLEFALRCSQQWIALTGQPR